MFDTPIKEAIPSSSKAPSFTNVITMKLFTSDYLKRFNKNLRMLRRKIEYK